MSLEGFRVARNKYISGLLGRLVLFGCLIRKLANTPWRAYGT